MRASQPKGSCMPPETQQSRAEPEGENLSGAWTTSTCYKRLEIERTAFVERLNLDIRQRVAAIGRRVHTLCQGEAGGQDQLALCQVSHNVVLPHASLRQAGAAPMATNGRGLAKMWRPCTPAMAAGLTDHVWSRKEVLWYRGPPGPQTQTV